MSAKTEWVERVLGLTLNGSRAPAGPLSEELPAEILEAAKQFVAFQEDADKEFARLSATLADEDLGEIDRAAALSDMHELQQALTERLTALNVMAQGFAR